MKQVARLIVPLIFLFFPLDLIVAQTQQNQKTTATSQKPKREALELGRSYAELRPEQVRLIDSFIRSYNSTTGSALVPQQVYDDARLSIRTTFDSVTHALINAQMNDSQGRSLGRAIDLVAAVDQVMGEEAGAGGDMQFRLYVYLKPDAVDILSRSQEFLHDKDNSVYHKGFPICYRLKKGPHRFSSQFRATTNCPTLTSTIALPAFRRGWSMDTCPLPTPTSARETT